MYCDNCGNQLRDGAKFCPKCGNKIPSDSTEVYSAESITNKDDITDIGDTTKNTTKKPFNKKILIPIVASLLAVVITVLVIVNSCSTQKSTQYAPSFSIPAGYNLELKDSYALLGTNEKNEYANLIAIADNGVFVAGINDGGVAVYTNNDVKKIETNSEKPLLSGDGSKLVYTGTDKKIYYYDVQSGNATEINNPGNKEYTPEKISYDGSTICLSDSMGLSVSENGKEPSFINAFSHLLAISDNGDYIYYYTSTVSYTDIENGERKNEKHHNDLHVWHNHSVQTIIEQSDPEHSYSITSINRTGNEIIFNFNKDSYYYSYNTKQMEKISKDLSERLFSIESFRYNSNHGLTYKEYNDYMSQDNILNSFYILIETNGYRIGYLNDKYQFQVLTETINEYGREFSISSDRKKLWCANNGKLSYYMAEDSSIVKKTVDLPVKKMDSLHYISANDDCSEACFVSTDGYAYLVNPDTISNPQKIDIANSFMPTYDASGNLYVLALENPEKFSEDFCELYSVDKNGQKSHEYSHVSKVAPTQNHLYIFVGGYTNSGSFDILEKTDSGYTTVYSETEAFQEVWN